MLILRLARFHVNEVRPHVDDHATLVALQLANGECASNNISQLLIMASCLGRD